LQWLPELQEVFSMEEIDIVDELEAGPGNQKAPMLKVLCILTWVYCFFSILFLSVYFVNGSNLASMFSVSGNETMFYIVLWGIIMPIMCAVGALLMWFKLRIGIIVYGVGQLSPVLYSLITSISVLGFGANGVFFVVLRNLIPIAFFVLYVTQVKYMKPWRS
jgi:hypothetical protein